MGACTANHWRCVAAILSIFALCVISVLPAHARQAPESFAPLVERLMPAVVNISTTQTVTQRNPLAPFMAPDMGPNSPFAPFKEFFEHFGGGNGREFKREVSSLGSGFIISPEGYVVTNNHVIAEAEEITVIFNDESKHKAEVVGRDSKTDIALLKIDVDRPLPYVRFGDSDSVRVGDWILAIGNPFGLGGTVTAGIISARARDINAGPFDDFLQTDAAINRGNSGGPMFNMRGEVIGIATAIFSPDGGNIGIGFAIPTALAKPVIAQLKEIGHTRRGWLGVRVQRVSEEIAESVGLKKARGAMITEVTEDSPAEKSGLQNGDIILRFDGKTVEDVRKLPRIVAATEIGRTVPVEVWRNERRRRVDITLGEMPDEDRKKAEAEKDEKAAQNAESVTVMGMKLARLNDRLRRTLKVPKTISGVVITGFKDNSNLAKSGLRPGDVIQRINRTDTDTPADVTKALKNARASGRNFALLRVYRRGVMIFLTVPTEKE